MGKATIRKFGVVLLLLPIAIGVYLIYQVVSPELEYKRHMSNDNELFSVRAESVDEITEDRLFIPAIGVDLNIGLDYETLDTGGWVQELNDKHIPNLIGIHRFGLNTLSAEEKIKTTLYHVKKLNTGDEVVIWWRGEEYTFKVEEIYESTQKPEIQDDELYLYTCLLLGQDERIFVRLK